LGWVDWEGGFVLMDCWIGVLIQDFV